ncbi:STAS-like domain-containing protein [Pigmentiphaga kullae]|uniref:Uncharacterized protein DUF4325 n=1 Tax=Pigmentiphaga kullae TaxID=151784 RepID=A0A4Q7NCI2_9BURK|nr:STAS-like domain-containing protein [Pigmentiphaga kullae]RZS80623.1 uncharacterized protein DUF4325 [Pigmentiphaga kullae]
MVITALQHVRQCYSYADGKALYDVFAPRLLAGDDVTISFDGVSSLPSSFVNAALVPLLEHVSLDFIKKHLRFANTNSQMNDMIRSRLAVEAGRMGAHA